MAWMVAQQYTSAIREAYAPARSVDSARSAPSVESGFAPESVGSAELERNLAEAQRAREWLESLSIDSRLRAALVEPIAALEDGFSSLLREASPTRS